MDNVIFDQNIQFKCSFKFDLCDGYSKRDIYTVIFERRLGVKEILMGHTTKPNFLIKTL